MIKRLFIKGIKKIRRTYFPTPQHKVLKRFDNENGLLKTLNHENLNDTSLILDVGGYLGDFSAEMFARYNCQIKIFEPVPIFAEAAKKRFAKNNKVEVLNYGLGGENKIESITIDGDASSFHSKKTNKEAIQIKTIDVIDWMNEYSIDNISLASINIEGGEYPLLERILQAGYICKFENLQIQFHEVYQKDAAIRMEKIQVELAKTHELTYQYKFVWENWKLKKNN